jgi:hypothetical protein
VKIYPTEAKAYMRVSILRRYGCWPGIVRCDGGYRLAYDPDLWYLT